ncbi:MAG: hypothetical protein HYV07_09800 [Deltaproteobacteria bacterium]|nr:hypothetical protein [Deltaproteobacteria bacterium]
MKTILLAGAGGGGSINLARALRATNRGLRLIGSNSDRFALARSPADPGHSWLVPHSKAADEYLRALNEISVEEEVELLIPTNDTELGVLSARRAEVQAPMCLPDPAAVAICQDKGRFAQFMEGAGLPSPRGLVVERYEDLTEAFASFDAQTVWLRLRSGTGSRGTLPVRSGQQAEFWIRYWADRIGATPSDFVLNDYLSGREYAWMAIFDHGRFVASKTAERLEYLFGANTPSGTMSTPRVAKLVFEPGVDRLGEAAVLAVDSNATGVFSLDIKEDSHGRPHVTEINIGRFFRISPIFNLSGHVNLAELFLQVAEGRQPIVPEAERHGDFTEDTWWICDIEDVPSVLTETALSASMKKWTRSP